MPFLHEGAEFVAESGRTYLAVSSLGQDNVWIGAEKGNEDHIVILKSPASFDAPGFWPKFQQEMTMHELFKDCQTIREQVDRVAPGESGSPPILVLAMVATTLGMARNKRPFSRPEIVAIVRGLLESLRDIHDKGLVYSDVKMPNIMLDGFSNRKPSADGSDLTVKLGDLGEVMYPSTGTAQPIAYRAPEVFFKGEIGPASDIWAVGLVLSHLLEAQTNFSENGLYRDLFHAHTTADQSVRLVRSAIANDYDLKNSDYYKACTLPHSKGEAHVNNWDALQGRLSPGDIAFLEEIMQADPRTRPTAASLLQNPWFKDNAPTTAPVTAAHSSANDNTQTATSAVTKPQAPDDAPSAELVAAVSANATFQNASTHNENPLAGNVTNAHVPIEFNSINYSSSPGATFGSSNRVKTLDTGAKRTSYDITNDTHIPAKYQKFDQLAADAGKAQDAAPSEGRQEASQTTDPAPQVSPAGALSPISFRDINATVPDDFADEAASRIDNVQKRLSSRGVKSVQLTNQTLVDSKHKREIANLQPVTVGSTKSDAGTILNYR
ncbi:hypothetical protein DOTSEDRAFT_73213 [Dothistroma septosporum NZE10]|uniref:non-specific serine/threonine protein kinase n=1 Tax=Dothistroma septosporum (strain NZE10 / CBS 128990) TaxID=675120 RepID=N1PJL4_DOTSN|nr:hypothetical protein DOTSEDRAFT_73213 [Dothistroma septosporum NZE10]